jgi:hypothetical protein
MLNLLIKKEIEKYLKKKSAPIVVGPDKFYYITDRHHTSFAILKSKIPKKYKGLYIEVIKDFSNRNFEEIQRVYE